MTAPIDYHYSCGHGFIGVTPNVADPAGELLSVTPAPDGVRYIEAGRICPLCAAGKPVSERLDIYYRPNP